MRKIGYARVSSADQNLDRQIAALRTEQCDTIYREKVSGKAMSNRPELGKPLTSSGSASAWSWPNGTERPAPCSMASPIIERISKRGSLLKALDKPHLDLTTPLGRGFIAFLSAMAEDEQLRILRRCADGRAAAKARGVSLGRKSKLSEHQRQEARRRLEAGESARAIARSFGAHHATVLGVC